MNTAQDVLAALANPAIAFTSEEIHRGPVNYKRENGRGVPL